MSETPAPGANSPKQIGHIERRKGGSFDLERWSLYRTDGTLSNTFAADEDRAAVAAILAKFAMTLRDDNTVWA